MAVHRIPRSKRFAALPATLRFGPGPANGVPQTLRLCIMWTVIHRKFHARTWSRMSVQNAGSCQQHKQKLSGTLQACPDLQYLQDIRHDASSQKSENLALTQNLNELSIRPTADAWGSHGHGAYGAILGCRGCRLSLSFSWLVEFLVWLACQTLLPCRHP